MHLQRFSGRGTRTYKLNQIYSKYVCPYYACSCAVFRTVCFFLLSVHGGLKKKKKPLGVWLNYITIPGRGIEIGKRLSSVQGLVHWDSLGYG